MGAGCYLQENAGIETKTRAEVGVRPRKGEPRERQRKLEWMRRRNRNPGKGRNWIGGERSEGEATR